MMEFYAGDREQRTLDYWRDALGSILVFAATLAREREMEKKKASEDKALIQKIKKNYFYQQLINNNISLF